MNNEEYFSYKALSASQIKAFDKSPRLFWRSSPFNPDKKPETVNDALVFGKLAHCLLLEPEAFQERYFIADFGTSRKNKRYAFLCSENPGKELITQEEYDRATKMLANLRNHPEAARIVEGAVCETPILWKDKETGLPCKCKPDALKRTPYGLVVIDYKTSSDIDGLIRHPEKLQYPLQDVFYCEGVKARYSEEPVEFVFIVQSNKEDEEDVIAILNTDYDSRLIAKDILSLRKQQIKTLLASWEKTKDPFIFAAFPERMTMSYPSWYMNQAS